MAQAKKWLLSFAAIVLAVVLLFSVTTFLVDPGFQFRVRDNTYLLNSRYVAPGLVKNQTYDTILIGSSMVQNFDMDHFETHLGGEALKIGVGGMNTAEMTELLNLAYTTGKAQRYYLCVDISYFQAQDASKNRQYMFRNDILSRCRYFLSYETWLRYLPLGIASSALQAMDLMPAGYAWMTNIDMLGDWSADFSCGRDAVLENYRNNTYGVSSVDTDGLVDRMKANILTFFEQVDAERGEHIFIFPPYSALFWCRAQTNGYFDAYQEAKAYFSEMAIEVGCTVYDFQAAELILNLDNYRDLTHYGDHINDWMTEQIAAGEYRITQENSGAFRDLLVQRVATFRQVNPEIFDEE